MDTVTPVESFDGAMPGSVDSSRPSATPAPSYSEQSQCARSAGDDDDGTSRPASVATPISAGGSGRASGSGVRSSVPASVSAGASVVGASVWLCAARAGERDPDVPRWASSLVAEYSCRGQRVHIRAAVLYPGLPGEVAALLHAAAATDRDAVAILPGESVAARTRALLPAFADPNPPLCPEQADTEGARRPRVLVDRAERPATTDLRGAAGLMVVLTGPVRPGATSIAASRQRRAVTAAALTGWARELAPGATLVLLCPPQPGSGHDRPDGDGQPRWTDAVRAAGLTYTQHVVLVHVPIIEDTVAPPGPEPAEPGPFAQVHTDAFVLTAPPTLASARVQVGPAGWASGPDSPLESVGASVGRGWA